jgi:quercetin dioxygenase-like cupin family protein
MKVRYFGKNDVQEDFLAQFNQEVDMNRCLIRSSEAFPVHSSIQDLNLIVVSGKLTLSLNGQRESSYPAGSLIFVPIRTRISMSNQTDHDLEIITARAVSSRIY